MTSDLRLIVFADYFQFIVQDEQSEDDFSELWTAGAAERALAVGESAICPGTLRNVEVAVEVHVLDEEPAFDLASVDHAVEASLWVSSGVLVVMGCTGYFAEAPRIEIPPGSYRVLSVMQGLSSITSEWGPAEDSYVVYLWPGEPRHPKLLKHWRTEA
jgi:hypothetical protein